MERRRRVGVGGGVGVGGAGWEGWRNDGVSAGVEAFSSHGKQPCKGCSHNQSCVHLRLCVGNEQRTTNKRKTAMHTAVTAQCTMSTIDNQVATMHVMHCTHTHTHTYTHHYLSIIQSPLPPIAPLPNHVHSLRSFTSSFARSLVHCNTGTGVSFNHRSWK